MSNSEIQDTPLVPARRDYHPRELRNQPNWPIQAKMLAETIHRLDRGDVPDRFGNRGCFASLEHLANEMGTSLSTVSRWLRWLKTEGVLHELDKSRGGIVYRRIVLKWDVRERVFTKRKAKITLPTGQTAYFRIKKSDLPADVPYCHTRQEGVVTCDNRKGSISETNPNPVVPFRDKNFNSVSEPNPSTRDEPSSRNSEASTGLAKGGWSRREKVMAVPELVEALKDDYPVEKQNDRTIGILWGRWRRGTLNLDMLQQALETKRRLWEMDKPIRFITDFHHFLINIDTLISYDTEGYVHSVRAKIYQGLSSLDYPELRGPLEDGKPLSDSDFYAIADWVRADFQEMLGGSPDMQDLKRLRAIANGTDLQFLKTKFNEKRSEFVKQYGYEDDAPDEV